MKKWTIKVLYMVIFVLPVNALAQSANAQPSYKENPALPVFSLVKTGSNEAVSTGDIAKGKPTMFIQFMPDCDHCEKLADTLVMNMNALKNINIYMITPATPQLIEEFIAKKRLAGYKNLVIAQDSKVFFANFFNAYDVPFVAIYDRNKQFVTSFGQHDEFRQVLKALKAL